MFASAVPFALASLALGRAIPNPRARHATFDVFGAVLCAAMFGLVISGLEALKRPCVVRLYTDSRYVLDGATRWIKGWKKNGWRTADKKPVKNIDLWQRLDEALAHHNVEFIWVRGHAGHPENERADELAREGIAKARTQARVAE